MRFSGKTGLSTAILACLANACLLFPSWAVSPAPRDSIRDIDEALARIQRHLFTVQSLLDLDHARAACYAFAATELEIIATRNKFLLDLGSERQKALQDLELEKRPLVDFCIEAPEADLALAKRTAQRLWMRLGAE